MANDYSGIALGLAVFAIVFIIVMIIIFAVEYDNVIDEIAKDVSVPHGLMIVPGNTGAAGETFAAGNQMIYVNAPTSSLILTIAVPDDIQPGNVFYISNTNLESTGSTVTHTITVVPGSGVTLTNRGPTTTTTQIIIPGARTGQFMWRSATEITFLDYSRV